MTRAALSRWLLPALLCCGCTVHGSIGSLCVGPTCTSEMDGAIHPDPMMEDAAPSDVKPTASGMPRDAAVDAAPMSGKPDASACRVQPVALQRQLAMHFLIDNSFGVGAWWQSLLNAFAGFVADPRSASISVGLSFIGVECSEQASFLAPAVPLAALPNNSAAITGALPNALQTSSDKPTLHALRGTLSYARSWALQHPGTPTLVVLVMEDLNETCDTDEDQVVQAAREGFENTVSIPTHVIALQADLDPVARAGGTGSARPVSLLQPDGILPAMYAIRDAALPSGGPTCSIVLPVGQRVDSARAQLRLLMQDGSELTIAGVQRQTACPTLLDGFYYDDLTSSLVGCDQSCVKLISAVRVDLLSECPAR